MPGFENNLLKDDGGLRPANQNHPRPPPTQPCLIRPPQHSSPSPYTSVMVCVICPPHLSSSPPHIIVSQFLSSGAVGLFFPITEAQSSGIMAPSCSKERAAPLCRLNSRSLGSRRAGRPGGGKFFFFSRAAVGERRTGPGFAHD